MHVKSHVGLLPITVAFILSTLCVSSAYADSITLMWDANTDPVTGYAVYVGSSRVDVGNTTSYTLTSAVAGQQYCFAVAAYNAAGEGAKSGQLCGYSNRYPSLSNPGNQSATAGQATTLQLSGSDPDGQPISYTASGMPPGLFIGSATGYISGTPTTAGNYSVTASVFDGVLTSASQTFTWSVAGPAPDTTVPSVSITAPTSAASYSTTTSTMTLGGTASDNVGVTWVGWANNRGGSGVATGITNWSAGGIGLQSGTNVITVTARDGSGNVATDVLTVTYSVPDTTAPTVTISGPTSASTYATASQTLAMSGTASDSIGVTQVSWVNDRGGSGTATGTTSWNASGITLQSGTNNITVTARDAANNQSTDVLAVTYTPADTAAPTVTILGPTSSSSYSTTSAVVTLGGSSADDRGVTAVSWANNRGGTGFSSGTTSWSVPSVPLQSGSNVITVTAEDAAGNKGTDVLTVNYNAPDTTLPTVAIATPTSLDTYATTSSSLQLAGTASDNVGVTQVTWQNSLGGASGTATGTGNWSVAAVPLQPGSNVITVVARDAAGNQSSDVLTVSYSAPQPAPVPAPTPSLTLSGRLYSSGRWAKAYLEWSSVQGRYIDIYQNGSKVDTKYNSGSTTENVKGNGPYLYKVCVSGSPNVCSNSITLSR
jgi:putative Ig domain-containing protein/fibronectin type III domain protein/Big-like domain-containing protein